MHKNNVWIGVKDLEQSEEFISQASQETSLIEQVADERNTEVFASNRRDFLKYLGFGLGAATIAAGCDIPVRRAIPYVIKPDAIVPGIATYYSSSFVDGGDYASIIVKTRDGRPIKVEGNDLAPNNWGTTSGRVQASVISLYDTNRLASPKKKNGAEHVEIKWETLDSEVTKALALATNIRIVQLTNISPTAKKAQDEFIAKYPSTKVVELDNGSYSGLLDANQADFGVRAIPSYHFDKADVIVSFGADFLGTWVAPTKFAAEYVKKRVITDVKNPVMSKHIQVESGMSLTGSNADNRILVKPSEQGVAIAQLYNEIVVGGGAPSTGLNAKAKASLTKVAAQLKAASGRSIVVSGSNSDVEQQMVNAINNALGNYGTTINFGEAILTKRGDDKAFAALVAEMKAGSVDAIIIDSINPVYTSALGASFAEGLKKVKTKIAVGLMKDETNILCDYIAIKPHFLESWGDAQPTTTISSILQPTIAPLFKSRQAEESYLTWAQSPNLITNSTSPYYDYLKSSWTSTKFASQSEFATADAYWGNLLQLGVVTTPAVGAPAYKRGAIATSGLTKPASSEVEISFYEPVSVGLGQYATNPWLQEMVNPVDKTVWGNYLAVPVNFDGMSSMVGFKDLQDGDLAELTIGDKTFKVPVIQQFGQMPGTVSLALGYGRTEAGACGTGVGVDMMSSQTMVGGYAQPYNTNVKLSGKIGKEDHFSCVQYHNTYGVTAKDKSGQTINADEAATVFFDYFTGVKGFQGSLTDRSVIYTANAKDLAPHVDELIEKREHAQFLNSKQIYGGHDYKYETGHHWGMHIDLNACTGCGACAVACMSENNIPIVGKREVSRHHEMTWLRIDRYYYGELENPNTVYQPMMCQHCDNAPCENVCPVNATNHSSEGLNQMTYNRCIGTRYCANNCPFKVRRFNWYDYTTADSFPANQIKKFGEDLSFGADNLTRMVLNPDVTVRSKGVIEKCSFCVQRIQEGKLTAKREGRALRDADVKTACVTSCPTGAITFGDMNNAEGILNGKLENPLNFIVLEETNVRPSVQYTMKVNNRDESLNA